MPLYVEKISKKINSVESLEDLFEFLKNFRNRDLFYDDILKKLQELPLANFSELIWEMLRRKGVWIEALQILSNRIVNEGLMDSDKSWDEQIEVIPIIVVMTTTDRSRIDLKYLAITLSALKGYDDDFPYHEWLSDDCSFTLKQMFTQSGDKIIGDLTKQIDPDNMGGTTSNWIQANLDAINILTNADARDIFLEKLIGDRDAEHNRELLQNMSAAVTPKVRSAIHDEAYDISDEEICDWVTYLVVTLQSIYQKYSLTWTAMPIQKQIISEWAISLQNLIDNLPWGREKNSAVVEILKPLALAFVYEIHRGKPENFWMDSLYNILTAATIDSKEGVIIAPQFRLALEASYRDFDDQNDDEDNDSDDSDDDNTAEDRKARRDDTYGKDRRKKLGRSSKYDEDTTMGDKAARKIYAGYRAYRDNAEKVDGQITKIVENLKDRQHRKVREQIVEGKKFSLIRILKKVMSTAAVFSYSKVLGIIFIIVRHFRSNKATNQERISMLEELQLEIKMLDEKIEDARGDGNRQAKYAMMRTRSELQKAYDQIKYGLTAGAKAKRTAKDLVRHKLDLGKES